MKNWIACAHLKQYVIGSNLVYQKRRPFNIDRWRHSMHFDSLSSMSTAHAAAFGVHNSVRINISSATKKSTKENIGVNKWMDVNKLEREKTKTKAIWSIGCASSCGTIELLKKNRRQKKFIELSLNPCFLMRLPAPFLRFNTFYLYLTHSIDLRYASLSLDVCIICTKKTKNLKQNKKRDTNRSLHCFAEYRSFRIVYLYK